MLCPRPIPLYSISHRSYIPFQKKIEFRLVAGVFNNDRLVYRSPSIYIKGYTRVDAFVGIQVLTDNQPNNAIEFNGGLVQFSSSGGSIGPVVDAGAQVGYTGPNKYTFFLQSGGQQIQDSISNDICFGLRVRGQGGQNRILTISIDGILVSGKTYFIRRR